MTLRPCCFLATKITKWTRFCDKALHRLMCYMHSTPNTRMCGWVGDDVKDWELVLYADADFAGDRETSRSTSGVFLCIRGPITFFPLAATSKRQSCVSHSTPEAEIVAADLAIRTEGLPGATLWEALLGRPVTVRFMEDNSAAIITMKNGHSPAMRHIGRIHRVDLAFIAECSAAKHFSVEYCPTSLMRADIFTKAFSCKVRWWHATLLIAHIDPAEIWPKRRVEAVTPKKSKPTATSAPAPSVPEPTRFAMEFCCSQDSEIGRVTAASKGCEVVRITLEHDVTTAEGLKYALAQARAACKDPRFKVRALIAALPCTGGSPWQHLNAKKPGGAAKLRKTRRVFRQIWAAFLEVAEVFRRAGGEVIMEWPSGCAYWKWPEIQAGVCELSWTQICPF